MEHDLLTYKQYYFFSQFARNRLSWDVNSAISRNAAVFDKILLTFQYMYFYRASNPAFFETDLGKDFLKASQAGLDLYSEVIAMPEFGSFLESAGQHGFTVNSRVRGRWLTSSTADYLDLNPAQLNQANNNGSRVGLPTYYYGPCEWGGYNNEGYCGQNTRYPGFICDGDNCDMPVELGDGRPSFLNYTNDYEDWFFTYVGNYFDKQNVLINMVISQAYFPQLGDETGISTNPNRQQLTIGLSSLFGDSIRRIIYSMVTNKVEDYASFYRPGEGYKARSFAALDPAEHELQPNDVYLLPRRITNLPYLALAYGMIFQSSLDDSVLDFTAVAQIGVKGEEDDVGGWDGLSATDKVEFTHPSSGITYRAARVGNYPIAFDLVTQAMAASERYLELKECTDTPSKNDGACACTYVGAFRTEDKNGDGNITGTGSGSAADECVLLQPQNGLDVCERRVEPCEGADRVDLRDRAFERMEAQVEMIENVRGFYQAFAGADRL